MQAKEILIDLLEAQQKALNGEFAELNEVALNWRPDSEANSIGITIWHLARVADFVLSYRLEGRPAGEQRWFLNGWAAKTGYDPRGIGSGGMGILTGYNQQEVANLPAMPNNDLFAYHNEVYGDLLAYLRQLPDEGLDNFGTSDGPQRTIYFWYRVILLDATRHTGEMQALKAMWRRQEL